MDHGTCRGIEGCYIFRDDTDVVDRLSKLRSDTATACLAWAMLPNRGAKETCIKLIGVQPGCQQGQTDCFGECMVSFANLKMTHLGGKR